MSLQNKKGNNGLSGNKVLRSEVYAITMLKDNCTIVIERLLKDDQRIFQSRETIVFIGPYKVSYKNGEHLLRMYPIQTTTEYVTILIFR